MPRNKQSQIDELERSLTLEQGYISKLKAELDHANGRLKLVAAENEELRRDKQWLKQVIQNMLPGRPV